MNVTLRNSTRWDLGLLDSSSEALNTAASIAQTLTHAFFVS